jgi:hypothetical protein
VGDTAAKAGLQGGKAARAAAADATAASKQWTIGVSLLDQQAVLDPAGYWSTQLQCPMFCNRCNGNHLFLMCTGAVPAGM